jgi:hypothetical protein
MHEEEVLKNEWTEILSAISVLSFLLMVCVLSPPRSDESGKQVIAFHKARTLHLEGSGSGMSLVTTILYHLMSKSSYKCQRFQDGKGLLSSSVFLDVQSVHMGFCLLLYQTL